MRRFRFADFADAPETRSMWRVNQVYWACIGFILVWVGLRALGAGGGPPLARPGWFLAVLALAGVNLALRSLSALRPGHDRRGALFTAADLLLIALGLQITGGRESPLWIVIFVVVLGETVLSPSREATRICLGASAALIAGTWPPGRDGLGYGFDLATRLVFLTIVSIITRRLRENHQIKNAELANLRAELAAAGERTRLSREIHDGVGNALAAAVLRLEVAARVGEKRPGEAAGVLREEAGALREAMRAVRDWTFFARPWSAATGGKENAPASEILTRETDRFSRRTGLPVLLDGAALLDALPEPARVAALRITQEALTNAAKHAGATRVVVTLAREGGDALRLTIRDDGRGFDPAAGEAGAGIGITSMRERAEMLGGGLSVDAAPGGGVLVTARLPRA